MFVIAVTLQHGLRYGALAAGLALVPMGVAQFAASVLAPRLADRLGSGRVDALSAGQVQGRWSRTDVATLWPLAGAARSRSRPAWCCAAAARAGYCARTSASCSPQVPPARAGAGSGLAATAQQSGLALGVATLGSLFLALCRRTREALTVVLLDRPHGSVGGADRPGPAELAAPGRLG